jgi:hypothetical protein
MSIALLAAKGQGFRNLLHQATDDCREKACEVCGVELEWEAVMGCGFGYNTLAL